MFSLEGAFAGLGVLCAFDVFKCPTYTGKECNSMLMFSSCDAEFIELVKVSFKFMEVHITEDRVSNEFFCQFCFVPKVTPLVVDDEPVLFASLEASGTVGMPEVAIDVWRVNTNLGSALDGTFPKG